LDPVARLRHARAVIALLWLTCNTATLALVPVLFDTSIAACTCAHGADAMCPMHHKATTGATRCAMQSTSATAPAVLNALLSIAGLLPSASPPMKPVTIAQAVLAERSTLTDRPSPPDSPPPRL